MTDFIMIDGESEVRKSGFYTVTANFDMASYSKFEVKSFLHLENANLFAYEMKEIFLSEIPNRKLDDEETIEEHETLYRFKAQSDCGEDFISVEVLLSHFEDSSYQDKHGKMKLTDTQTIISTLQDLLTLSNIERGLTEDEQQFLSEIESRASKCEDYKLAHLIRKLLYIQRVITDNGGNPVAKEIVAHVASPSFKGLKSR